MKIYKRKKTSFNFYSYSYYWSISSYQSISSTNKTYTKKKKQIITSTSSFTEHNIHSKSFHIYIYISPFNTIKQQQISSFFFPLFYHKYYPILHHSSNLFHFLFLLLLLFIHHYSYSITIISSTTLTFISIYPYTYTYEISIDISIYAFFFFFQSFIFYSISIFPFSFSYSTLFQKFPHHFFSIQQKKKIIFFSYIKLRLNYLSIYLSIEYIHHEFKKKNIKSIEEKINKSLSFFFFFFFFFLFNKNNKENIYI